MTVHIKFDSKMKISRILVSTMRILKIFNKQMKFCTFWIEIKILNSKIKIVYDEYGIHLILMKLN